MTEKLEKIVEQAIEDLKGKDVSVIDVTSLSDVMDKLVIVTGTSNRHVKSIADSIVEESKKAGSQPLGVEGKDAGEWVLVDFGDIVVHVMQAQTREFYDLEKLWSMEPSSRQGNDDTAE